jgi:hypothetical protein
MDYRIEIQKVDNGYIITDHTNMEACIGADGKVEGIADPRVMVFEEKDNCERENMVHLLYAVLEIFGESGSKHDEHKVRIRCLCDKG